jgi:hypothetical protein
MSEFGAHSVLTCFALHCAELPGKFAVTQGACRLPLNSVREDPRGRMCALLDMKARNFDLLQAAMSPAIPASWATRQPGRGALRNGHNATRHLLGFQVLFARQEACVRR